MLLYLTACSGSWDPYAMLAHHDGYGDVPGVASASRRSCRTLAVYASRFAQFRCAFSMLLFWVSQNTNLAIGFRKV